MPRLWNETIDAHRRDVREAIFTATRELVDEDGLLSVTMSRVAERTGIGRATLYKYFPSVEAILQAHHERHVAHHLAHLEKLRDHPGEPADRLESVLTEYAMICFYRQQHSDEQLAALLHRGEVVERAEQQVHKLFRDLLAQARKSGDVRDDMSLGELAGYCVHALAAAGNVRSEAAARRLVAVTLAGLRRPRP